MPSLKFPLSLEISSLCSESAAGSIDITNIDTNTNTHTNTNTNSKTITNANRNDGKCQVWNILSPFEISPLCSESAAGSNDIASVDNQNIWKTDTSLTWVRVIERPLLSTGSISNCKYHGTPGKVE